ncbi:hypothetical protein PMAYCL1PPCAC_03787, partial [Pristionchus mayeri]
RLVFAGILGMTVVEASHANSIIDWKSCGKEAVCGVRDDCLFKTDRDEIVAQSPNQGKDFAFGKTLIFGKSVDPQKCKAGIWIRPITESVWIVKMQVMMQKIGNDEQAVEKIEEKAGIVLYHGREKQFGC